MSHYIWTPHPCSNSVLLPFSYMPLTFGMIICVLSIKKRKKENYDSTGRAGIYSIQGGEEYAPRPVDLL